MSQTIKAGDASSTLRLWRLSDRKTRRLLTALAAALAAMLGLSIGVELSSRIYGDYFAMWSFARFAMTHPVAAIYDPAAVHAFQHQCDPSFTGVMPFPYPPSYILLLLPFGLLPIALGWTVWSATGLCAYMAAIFAGRWRSDALLFVALAPATVMSLISGQNGLFSSALMVAGVRLMDSRPIAAGVLFGLMSFKPQVGLLIPVALIAARNWRAFAAAAAAAIGLAGLASAAFGVSIWPTWIGALRTHWDGYVTQGNATRIKMPTITANLEMLGVGPQVAQLVQLAAFGAAAMLVWAIFRRRQDAWALAALLVGCFVATPYALFYDLPAVTFAIVVVVMEMGRADRPWHWAEVLVLLLAFLMPYAQFVDLVLPVPVNGAALVLLFMVIVRRALEPRLEAT